MNEAGVVKEPVVPLPPPPLEMHEVLLVDVQWMTVVAPLAIEAWSAQSVTLGVVPEPPGEGFTPLLLLPRQPTIEKIENISTAISTQRGLDMFGSLNFPVSAMTIDQVAFFYLSSFSISICYFRLLHSHSWRMGNVALPHLFCNN